MRDITNIRNTHRPRCVATNHFCNQICVSIKFQLPFLPREGKGKVRAFLTVQHSRSTYPTKGSKPNTPPSVHSTARQPEPTFYLNRTILVLADRPHHESSPLAVRNPIFGGSSYIYHRLPHVTKTSSGFAPSDLLPPRLILYRPSFLSSTWLARQDSKKHICRIALFRILRLEDS